jgi:N-acetylmuramoyl-L-alanine amidase
LKENKRIIIHCSASDNIAHDNIETIDRWHRERGWSGVGYHFFIRSNGTIELGRPLWKVGAHVRGHNHDSIGICLSGIDDFSYQQLDSLEKLVKDLMYAFNISVNNVYGHYELDNKKSCPNMYMHGFREKIDNGLS